MQKVSRSLLLAGMTAFGVLTAACGSETIIPVTTTPATTTGVTSITVTPPSATFAAGTSITLAASVVADAATAKTVTWTTSSSAVATVDATGKVTGVAAGTATITATATADPTKAAASFITIQAAVGPVLPTISIASVTDLATNNPVNLGNVAGQINVTVNTSGGGLVEIFLSTSCTTNTISATDVAAASQVTSSAQAGQVTLSINTAALTSANAPRWINGAYCIKSRLTSGTQTVVATNTTALTLNNANRFTATYQFASQTGGPVSAVSTVNGLNYNQGTMTVTVTPIIFTSASPAALISGSFTRNGEQSGGASPGVATFTNQAVATATNTAVIAMTDTGSTAGVRSIFAYTSQTAGDTLYISAITDAAGNPIPVSGTGPGGSLAVAGVQGVRIDNDAPTLATNYTVTAANGYIGAAYSFASGTTGTASDTRAAAAFPANVPPGVQGVGGITTTYYAGTPGAGTAFATANSCSVTGLLAVATGSDLAATSAITPYAAKVVVSDALGNKRCSDISPTGAASTGVTQNTGLTSTFGVDKLAPTIAFVPPTPVGAPSSFSNNNGASDLTAYAVTKNFSLNYQDDISGFTNAPFVTTPLKGTLTRNSFAANTASSAANCVLGTFTASSGACADVSITPTSSAANTAPFQVNSIEITSGTAVAGYYLFTVYATDLALNASNAAAPVGSGTKISRLVAYDATAPAISALTQSPASVAGNGTVTVTGAATDNLDLASSSGRLSYSTNVPLPLQSVAGTSFGPNFDATLVTAASASVALPNVYRGVQSTTAGGAINADRATGLPTATITVTDVAGNTATSAAAAITTAAGANILSTPPVCSGTPNTFIGTPTNPAPGARVTTTNLTANLAGSVCDPTFQSQPLAQVDFYKVGGGELALIGSVTTPITTDLGAARSYSFTLSGAAVTAAAVNTYYAIGRNAAGDAIITQAITVTNP